MFRTYFLCDILGVIMTKKINFLNRFWRRWLIFLLGCFLLGLVFITYTFRDLWWKKTPPSNKTTAVETVLPFRHPLTGEPIATEVAKPQVFGVMIENSAEAWPLSGLEEAFLVIEAPVEAGIPRFLAFFDANQTVEKIGPVRSARPYYIDWAQEFGALYTHVGGSPAALEQIRNSGLFDLNQFWNDKYFWRSPDRLAPHNVYTSSELLNRVLINQEESQKFDYGLWSFKDDAPVENSLDSDLSLYQDSSLYQVYWQYNREENNYLRLQHNEEMKASDGDFIKANNVAVVYTTISIIDSIGRREIETVGQGEALVLQDGKQITAVWKKEAAEDRLRFYAEDGKEIKWNAGKTWIEVLSTIELGD